VRPARPRQGHDETICHEWQAPIAIASVKARRQSVIFGTKGPAAGQTIRALQTRHWVTLAAGVLRRPGRAGQAARGWPDRFPPGGLGVQIGWFLVAGTITGHGV